MQEIVRELDMGNLAEEHTSRKGLDVQESGGSRQKRFQSLTVFDNADNLRNRSKSVERY